MIRPSVRGSGTVVKSAWRPVGEVVGLFPTYDPERFLQTLDLHLLSQSAIETAVLGQGVPLPWPPRDPLAFADWLRDNEVRIVTQTLVRTVRGAGGWRGRFRLILGVEA